VQHEREQGQQVHCQQDVRRRAEFGLWPAVLVVVIIGVVGLFLPGGFWYGLGVIAVGGYFAYRNFSTMFRP